MNRILKRTAAALAVLLALYFMPFITTEVEDGQGQPWNAPFGVSFRSMDETSVTFSSLRSAYALGRDAENAVHSYEEEGCFGLTYYYDPVHDVSIRAHEEHGGLPSTLVYLYDAGHVCEGWTLDDEIAWPFGDPEEAYGALTEEAALEEGWLVIRDGKCLNVPVYNDFSRMVKQGVFCYLRTVLFEGGEYRIVDIQLCEDGHFRVLECDDAGCTEKSYIRLSDSEDSEGKKPVQVYSENSAQAEGVLLFTVE